jgi:tetratricopeptide (TPR) repeat protein
MMTERWLTSIACTPAALEQNPNRQEQVNDLFQMLTEIVGRDGDVYRRWGRILMQAGNLEGAEAKFKEALDVAEARLDARNEAMTLLRLAALDALRGKLDDALNKVDRADSTVLRAHLDEGDILRVQCLSSHYRGSIYYLRSRGKEAYLKEDKGVIPGSEYARDMALHAYKEAQELACRTDHQVMLSTTSSQIGKLRVLEALRTADEEAIDHGLEEILNAIRTLEAQDPALTAEAQLDYAEALLEADRARSAETYLDKWWEPLKRSATMLIFMTAHVVRARALRQLADDCGREGDTESARNFRKRSSEFAREATRFFKERGVKEGYTAREAAALADASEP